MTTTKRTRRKPPPRRNAEGEAPPVPATVLLDEKLDLHGAAPLRRSLSERRGAALVIDASRVDHLGAQCAQVLAAALAAWADDGVALAVAAPSDQFRQGARLLGLQSILITEGVPA